MNNSYKKPFILALLLHLGLILFLTIKFTNSSRSHYGQNIINATLVKENNYALTPPSPKQGEIKEVVQTQPIQLQKTTENVKSSDKSTETVKITEPKPKISHHQPTDIQNDILKEQAKEIVELKKERRDRKLASTKKQQREMQKMLHSQIASEKKQLEHDRLQELAKDSGGKNGTGTSTDTDKINPTQNENIGTNSNNGDPQSQEEENKYISMIRQAISSQWIKPDDISKNANGKILINLAPGGVVLSTQVLVSSGNIILDRSVQAAILKASPLPVPDDEKIFDKFRVVELKINPEGIDIN